MLANKISIFSLFIFLPLFLSFNNSGGFSFSRFAGVSDSYLYTVPISFIFVTLLILNKSIFMWLGDKLSSVKFFLFFLFSILCCLINYLIHLEINFSGLKVSFLLLIFLLLLEWFDDYFSRILESKKNLSHLERKHIIYPLLTILLISTLSNELIGTSAFLSEKFVVYNYEQYYAFTFVIFSSIVMQSKINFVFKLLVYYFSLSIAYSSANITAILLMILLVLWNILSLSRLKHLFHKLILILTVLLVPIYYILMYSFYDVGLLGSNFDSRVLVIRQYFNELNWLTFLFPFIQAPRGLFVDMHSQFLEVFNTLGWVGLIFFYGSILSRVRKIGTEYPDISVGLLLVVFIGGLIVNTTMHPYLIVTIAYIISFYYNSTFVLWKFKI